MMVVGTARENLRSASLSRLKVVSKHDGKHSFGRLRVLELTLTTVTIRFRMMFLGIAAVVIPLGCVGQSLPQNEYNPQAIAEAAMVAFDEDNNGVLDEEELQESPALQSAIGRIDTNQDEQIDAAEIANRVDAYEVMSEYIVAEVYVKRGRRPVMGAEVTLELSDFMDGIPLRFTAKTDASGVGFAQSSPRNLLGFPPGFYQVDVVHEGKTCQFGIEIADDAPSVNRLEFDLKDK